MASLRGIQVFYYVQGEKGDGEDDLNVFIAKPSGAAGGGLSGLTLDDVLRSFPLRGCGHFHFRFKVPARSIGATGGGPSGKGWVWLDVNDPGAPLPTHDGTSVFAKVLRTDALRCSARRTPSHMRAKMTAVVTPQTRAAAARRARAEAELRARAGGMGARPTRAARSANPIGPSSSSSSSSSSSAPSRASASSPASNFASAASMASSGANSNSGGVRQTTAAAGSKSAPPRQAPSTATRGGVGAGAAAKVGAGAGAAAAAAAGAAATTKTTTKRSVKNPMKQNGSDEKSKSNGASGSMQTPASGAQGAGAGIDKDKLKRRNSPLFDLGDIGSDSTASTSSSSAADVAKAAAAAAVAAAATSGGGGGDWDLFGGGGGGGGGGGTAAMAAADVSIQQQMEKEIARKCKDGMSDAVRAKIEARTREKFRKIQAAVDAKREGDAATAKANDEAMNARRELEKTLEKWKGNAKVGKAKDIRGLLANLHTVLWERAKWKQINMGHVLKPKRCKLHYRKAILVVHPDRVQNDDSATPQMKYTADIVFATLNEKYKEFEEAEL